MMAGRRAREYAERLVKFFAEINDLRARFTGLELSIELGAELCQQCCVRLSALHGYAKLKFGWVWQVPFTIWQCSSDREAAISFLQKGRQQVDARDPRINRITAYFVMEDAGCLGRLFEKYAGGEEPDAHLKTEFTAYEFLGVTEEFFPKQRLSRRVLCGCS